MTGHALLTETPAADISSSVRTPRPQASEGTRPYSRLAGSLLRRFLEDTTPSDMSISDGGFGVAGHKRPNEQLWVALEKHPPLVPSLIAEQRRTEGEFARCWEWWLYSQLANTSSSPARWIMLLAVPDSVRPIGERILPESITTLTLGDPPIDIR